MKNHTGLSGALRDIWAKHIRPIFIPEKPLNLFGVRYTIMQENLAALGSAEKDRLEFFIAAVTEDKPLRDYIDYIRHIALFCDSCVSRPESGTARGLDLDKITRLKTAADLLVSAIQRTDAAYLDRVRRDMKVPDFDAARQRVRRTEIQMLREDIQPPPKPRDP